MPGTPQANARHADTPHVDLMVVVPLLTHSDVRVVLLALVFLVLTTALRSGQRDSRTNDGTGRQDEGGSPESETESDAAKDATLL